MEPESNFGVLSAINGSKNGSKFGREEPFDLVVLDIFVFSRANGFWCWQK